MAKVVIIVRGGVVQKVYTDCLTTEIITVDRDVEGYPPAMIGMVLDTECSIPCLNYHGVYDPAKVTQADKESDKHLGEPEEEACEESKETSCDPLKQAEPDNLCCLACGSDDFIAYEIKSCRGTINQTDGRMDMSLTDTAPVLDELYCASCGVHLWDGSKGHIETGPDGNYRLPLEDRASAA